MQNAIRVLFWPAQPPNLNIHLTFTVHALETYFRGLEENLSPAFAFDFAKILLRSIAATSQLQTH